MYRFRYSFLWAMFFIFALAYSTHAKASDNALVQLEQATKDFESQAKKLHNALNTCKESGGEKCVDGLNQQLRRLEAAYSRMVKLSGDLKKGAIKIEQVYLNAKNDYEAKKREIAEMRIELRNINLKLARMRKAGPLAAAWDRYKRNRTEENFRKLFRLARGREPNSSELAEYDTQAIIIQREILAKSVTGIGLALVEIGKLSMTLVDVLTGEAFKDPLVKLGDTVKELVIDKALEESGLGEVFGASTIVKTVAGIGGIDTALGELEDAAKAMAEESHRKAIAALHGIEEGADLSEEIQKAEETRKTLEALASEKEKRLEPVEKALEEIKKAVEPVQKTVEQYDSKVQKFSEDLSLMKEEVDIVGWIIGQRARFGDNSFHGGKASWIGEPFINLGSGAVVHSPSPWVINDSPWLKKTLRIAVDGIAARISGLPERANLYRGFRYVNHLRKIKKEHIFKIHVKTKSCLTGCPRPEDCMEVPVPYVQTIVGSHEFVPEAVAEFKCPAFLRVDKETGYLSAVKQGSGKVTLSLRAHTLGRVPKILKGPGTDCEAGWNDVLLQVKKNYDISFQVAAYSVKEVEFIVGKTTAPAYSRKEIFIGRDTVIPVSAEVTLSCGKGEFKKSVRGVVDIIRTENLTHDGCCNLLGPRIAGRGGSIWEGRAVLGFRDPKTKKVHFGTELRLVHVDPPTALERETADDGRTTFRCRFYTGGTDIDLSDVKVKWEASPSSKNIRCANNGTTHLVKTRDGWEAQFTPDLRFINVNEIKDLIGQAAKGCTITAKFFYQGSAIGEVREHATLPAGYLEDFVFAPGVLSIFTPGTMPADLVLMTRINGRLVSSSLQEAGPLFSIQNNLPGSCSMKGLSKGGAHRTYIECAPTAAPGTYSITATYSALNAIKSLILLSTKDKPYLFGGMRVNLNRVKFYAKGGVLVAEVRGQTDMGRFKANWHFLGNKILTTSFEKKSQGGWTSTVNVTNIHSLQRLLFFEIINSMGQTVCKLHGLNLAGQFAQGTALGLRQPEGKAGVAAKGMPAPVRGKMRRIKKVELVRVIPKSGNNPVNTHDPIRNTTLPSGQVVYRAVDETEDQGGGAGGSTSQCTGATLGPCKTIVPMHVIFPGPPAPIYGANFDIGPCTLECVTPPPGVAGQGSFSITYAAGDPMNTLYCAGSAADPNSAWELQAGGHCNGYTPGQVVEFVAVSNKGRRLKVRFKVDTTTPPVLKVLSLTPLN